MVTSTAAVLVCQYQRFKKCLKSGQDWKEGFINGIKKSKYFIPFISKAGIATKPYNCKDSLRDHSRDNVLIEYETALHISQHTRNASFICPIVVGVYQKFMSKKQRQDGDVGGDDDGGGDGVEEEGLVKYRDFDASKFSTSITFDLNLQKTQMMNWFVDHVPSITEKKTFLEIINWACDKNIYTVKGIWTKLSSQDVNDEDDDNNDDDDDDDNNELDLDCSMEDLDEIKVQMELQFGKCLHRDEESWGGKEDQDEEEDEEEGEGDDEEKDKDGCNADDEEQNEVHVKNDELSPER